MPGGRSPNGAGKEENHGRHHHRVVAFELAIFAEGEGDTPNTEDANPTGKVGEENKETKEETKPADLNALLKGDKTLQSQFDKLISKALDTAKGRWTAEQNLTAEQLAQQKVWEREEELASREAEPTGRELWTAALEQMSAKGMPPELVDAINVADEAAMAQRLEKAEKAFRAAIDKVVKEKVQGSTLKSSPADLQSAGSGPGGRRCGRPPTRWTTMRCPWRTGTYSSPPLFSA